MEKLIEFIKKNISEIGSFNMEYTDIKRGIKVNGGIIQHFGQDSVRIDYKEKRSKYVFYRELTDDTLLEILYVVMRYKRKLKQYENYIASKFKTKQL